MNQPMDDEKRAALMEKKRAELLDKLMALRGEDGTEDQVLFDAVTCVDLPAALRKRADDAYSEMCRRLEEGSRFGMIVETAQRKNVGRGRPRNDYPAVIAQAWLRVSFLMWRDNLDCVPACRRLEKTGFSVLVYDTGDGEARIVEHESWIGYDTAIPMLRIQPDEASKPGENLRQMFYKFKELTPGEQWAACHALEQMKAAYEGRPSHYSRAVIDRMFPPAEV